MRFAVARLWDVLAVCLIAFIVWRVFIAPRTFAAAASAHPAPRAVFPRLGGGAFRVADQRGRLVFLDFYATWCEPCKLELPMVEKWAREHRNALVVPIDVAEPPVVVAAFAASHDMHGVALDPHGDAQGIFDVSGFPTIVVIDPAGRIRAKWEGFNPAIGPALSNALKQLGPAS